jgi:hypothetical protein
MRYHKSEYYNLDMILPHYELVYDVKQDKSRKLSLCLIKHYAMKTYRGVDI